MMVTARALLSLVLVWETTELSDVDENREIFRVLLRLLPRRPSPAEKRV